MLYSRTTSSSLAVAGARRQSLSVLLHNLVKQQTFQHSKYADRRWLCLAAPVIAAAAPTDEQPSAPADAAADSAAEQPLPAPSKHHMPQLTGKERAVLRGQAESLAKAKTLQRLQVGAQGISFNVLVSNRSNNVRRAAAATTHLMLLHGCSGASSVMARPVWLTVARINVVKGTCLKGACLPD
jgi:hypothetical protein